VIHRFLHDLSITVLLIETSCDETAVAVVKIVKFAVVLIPVPVHQQYGGVVPEVASRQHVETINQAITRHSNKPNPIQLVASRQLCAWTRGALLVGLTAAKTGNGTSKAVLGSSSSRRPHLC